jgi:argininosuccinate synthase
MGGVPPHLTVKKKVVLAYSGGLDTSVAIRWLSDQGWDVIAFTVDLGEKKDLDAIQSRALKTGATAAYVADGRLPFCSCSSGRRCKRALSMRRSTRWRRRWVGR